LPHYSLLIFLFSFFLRTGGISTSIGKNKTGGKQIFSSIKQEIKQGPSGSGFYIENTNLTDEQIGNHFDLVITPTSIRSRILNLMSDGNTWQLADLVTEVSKNVKQDSNTIKRFIESILETVPEIKKVDNAQYRLSEH
jgi:hypothetical protein